MIRIPVILKRSIFIYLCISLISASAITCKAYAQDGTSKNVLILNSYQKGLSWADHEVDGIMNTLSNGEPNCSIFVEYMDWKNYPTDENLENLYNSLCYKYSKKPLDVVITTDDAALEFALEYRKALFSDAPIVFCGVNETGVSSLTKNTMNVTGVVEEVDVERTIKAAKMMNPDLEEIYVVSDNTESGISTGELAAQEIKRLAPSVKITQLNQGGYKDILKQVEQAGNNSIIIITTYYVDDNGEVVGFENFTDMVSERSRVPVYHLYEFGINHGAIGGCMLFGELQGKRAGNMALRILQGTPASAIPIDRSSTTRYVFDYEQLKRFDIPTEKLPADSELINKPFSFIETYRSLVNTVLMIFAILVAFIIILIFYLRKINRMKQKLALSHKELSHLYDELATSDEELQQQFDELTIMQKNLLESEERYALLFERMLNGFFVFEPIYNQMGKLSDVRIITVNPSFEHHTNRKASRIIGKTWSEVFGEPSADLNKFEKVLVTGKAERFETFSKSENAYYLFNAFRIHNDQVGVVINNITDYKRAIEEIGQLNEDLEQRVVLRTKDLQNAIIELESFSYTVSHDLKSPLRAVDGYSKIILEDYEGELNQEVVSMISMIRGVCAEMIDMINKLLQYSTTTRIALQLDSVDSDGLFRTVFQELKATCPNRNIQLRIETGLPVVMADRILLKQVITNVLTNAIKFTKDREIAYLTIGATITESEYIFYVKDNGVGFDMNYSQKLFSIFQRLHTSEEFEGSGIGLATIKKIIEKHGGRTWIEGVLNEGATVYFTLRVI